METEKIKQIIAMVNEGKLNKDIAQALEIDVKEVRLARRKAGCPTRKPKKEE